MYSEFIHNNTCPCCLRTTDDCVEPKRALQEHLRRLSKTCPTHKMWFDLHYSFFFKHGGRRNEKPVTVEDVINSVKVSFGPEWSKRLSIQDV